MLAALGALRRGETTPVALVTDALRAAEQHSAHNTIATLDAERALAAASALTAERDLIGPLHGLPITVKDLYAVRGIPMRAGTAAPLPASRGLVDGDAVAVSRLRAAGAVIIGTTNLVEVAMGITGENPVTGDVRNAHDPLRQAGGSSSGSAVAVALGIGLGSLGSDTAGSVRIPAAFNGVVGLKPSYRTVPLDGALALSPTCDHAGPLARTVADARLLLAVLSGRDIPSHPVSAPRFGVPRRFLAGRLGTGVRDRFDALLESLREAGATFVDVEPPDPEPLLDWYTALSRPEAMVVHADALAADPDAFSPPVRDALLTGTRVLATDYLAAREARREARAEQERVLAGVDALLLPSAPLPAPHLGATEVSVESGTLAHRAAFLPFSLPFSFTGVPAVSVPAGVVDGLPVGAQIVGAFGDDPRVLDLAGWVEAHWWQGGR